MSLCISVYVCVFVWDSVFNSLWEMPFCGVFIEKGGPVLRMVDLPVTISLLAGVTFVPRDSEGSPAIALSSTGHIVLAK